MTQRRKHERWDYQLKVDLEDPSGFIFEAVGLNLSRGGLCLIFPHANRPEVGQLYGLCFALPNLEAPVKNALRVCWIDTIRSNICGGAFVDPLRKKELSALNDLIELDR